jgi:gamma-butyrobetaine dioxygenase
VAAKRYLCATEPGYIAALSAASRHSLALQGGPMQPAEIDAFRAEACYQHAVRLRRWDDAGKMVGQPTPDFSAFRPLLLRLIEG